TSTLKFRVKYDPRMHIDQHLKSGTRLFQYNKDNSFITEDVEVRIPAHTLYSDLHFLYGKSAQTAGRYSATHHIHNRMIPVHQSYNRKIKAVGLPQNLQDKPILVDTRGRPHGGQYKDGFVTANVRELGSF